MLAMRFVRKFFYKNVASMHSRQLALLMVLWDSLQRGLWEFCQTSWNLVLRARKMFCQLFGVSHDVAKMFQTTQAPRYVGPGLGRPAVTIITPESRTCRHF